MRHSPYGKGYLISSSGPRPAPFTWHNTQQFNYDPADSEQLRFHFLPGRKHHLNYQVTWTTPSREDECFSHSRSFQVVECPQRATPKDMFTNNPRWQGRPPPCLGQVSGESEPLGRRGRPCLENIYIAAQAELCDKPHGSSALRPGAQRWADTTTGRGQVSAHWTGHRDDAQCVRGWEMNERTAAAGPAPPITVSSSRDPPSPSQQWASAARWPPNLLHPRLEEKGPLSWRWNRIWPGQREEGGCCRPGWSLSKQIVQIGAQPPKQGRKPQIRPLRHGGTRTPENLQRHGEKKPTQMEPCGTRGFTEIW